MNHHAKREVYSPRPLRALAMTMAIAGAYALEQRALFGGEALQALDANPRQNIIHAAIFFLFNLLLAFVAGLAPFVEPARNGARIYW